MFGRPVEFKTFFMEKGGMNVIHENSTFFKEKGCWVYLRVCE